MTRWRGGLKLPVTNLIKIKRKELRVEAYPSHNYKYKYLHLVYSEIIFITEVSSKHEAVSQKNIYIIIYKLSTTDVTSFHECTKTFTTVDVRIALTIGWPTTRRFQAFLLHSIPLTLYGIRLLTSLDIAVNLRHHTRVNTCFHSNITNDVICKIWGICR